MSARGPRPAGTNTQADILAAARKVFGARGYEGASLRGIAREAGVDSALVHHYFSGKAQLFLSSVVGSMARPALDPQSVIATILQGPREEIGRRWTLAFLTFWDQEGGSEWFTALIQGVATSEEALGLVRQFLLSEILTPIVTHLGVDHPQLRAQLSAAQMIGLGIARYVAKLAPVAETDPRVLASLVGPTLQRYLVDDLPWEVLPGEE